MIHPMSSSASSPSGMAVISLVCAERNTGASAATARPVRGLPMMRRVLPSRSSLLRSICAPTITSAYAGSFICAPARAMVRMRFTRPVLKRRPKKSTAVGSTVHTTSPLLTGSIWFTCTPTLPAGHLPENSTTSQLAADSWAARMEDCCEPTPTYTLAILARAARPVWKSFSCPASSYSKSPARGISLSVDTKMAFGVVAGLVEMAYGSWLM